MRVIILASLLLPLASLLGAEPPSFRNDVMPVLFRGGCNTGTCHGSSRGRDGFHLSLFGYDPKGDLFRITQEMVGRRVNPAVPEASLLLLKATGKVPHTGGEIFTTKSEYYQTLLSWIEAGAPDDADDGAVPVEISLTPDRIVFDGMQGDVETTVTARYSDGSTRDVTSLSRFLTNNPGTATIDESGRVSSGGRGDTHVFAQFDRFTTGCEIVVLPRDSQFQWPNPPTNNYIDELVYERLKKLHLKPSELCDDETFLRRVYLDLTGLPPTVEQYREFIANPNRNVLIQQLLDSDGFARLWTGLWGESVRITGGGFIPLATDAKAARTYHRWIERQFRENRPFDEFVTDQIMARGSILTEGPAPFYTMMAQSTSFRPKEFAADFSQLMTGIRINCAECHNHPFDRWTMDDYYGFVSIFNGLQRKQGVQYRDFLVYNDPKTAPMRHLVDSRPMPATMLGAETAVLEDADKLRTLADWLTSPENPHFARNFANRVWGHFFARALVEPVDDIRVSNPPTNGPLLDGLEKRFTESGYDFKALCRDICESRVYQLSVRPNETNADDTRQFSRANHRRLRADVLMDTILAATEGQHQFRDKTLGLMAIELHPDSIGSSGDDFLNTFGRSNRNSICVCETSSEVTLSQPLSLMVGEMLNKAINEGPVIQQLLGAEKKAEEIVEELFIRALSRKPKTDELGALLELHAGDEAPDAQFYRDVFASLLSTSEFLFNH